MRTNRNQRVVALPLLSVFFALAACSVAGGDATGDQSQATHITPDGSDLPGSLKVVAPSGAPVSQVDADGLGGAIGDELSPLSVGSHQVHLASGGVMTTATATVASETLTTVQAAVVGVSLAGAPTTLGLTTGTGANIYDPATAGGGWTTTPIVDLFTDSTLQLQTLPGGAGSFAMLPGHYRIRFGMLDGLEFDVTAGNTYAVKAWDYAGRRVARIVAPKRDLSTQSCAAGAYTLNATASGASYTSATFTLADEKSIEVGAVASYANAAYTLKLPAVVYAIAVPLGDVAKGPLDLPIGRLDVDDVDVKQADGSTTKVHGYFELAALGTDSQGNTVVVDSSVLACGTLPTNSGVDLPRGKYRVTTVYSTVESGNKQDVMDVDVQ